MSSASLAPRVSSSERRSGNPRVRAQVPSAERSTPWLKSAIIVFTLMLVTGCVTVLWFGLRSSDVPVVSMGETVRVQGLEFKVTDARRRVDGMSGVNSKRLPMSGPAMPMGSMPGTAAGASSMGSMPGMAGMLEPGQERIDVAVALRNPGREASLLDPEEFRLVSSGRPVKLLDETVSEMTSSVIPAGMQLTATITFIVPEGTTPLSLMHPDLGAEIDLAIGKGSRQTPKEPESQPGGHGGMAHN